MAAIKTCEDNSNLDGEDSDQEIFLGVPTKQELLRVAQTELSSGSTGNPDSVQQQTGSATKSPLTSTQRDNNKNQEKTDIFDNEELRSGSLSDKQSQSDIEIITDEMRSCNIGDDVKDSSVIDLDTSIDTITIESDCSPHMQAMSESIICLSSDNSENSSGDPCNLDDTFEVMEQLLSAGTEPDSQPAPDKENANSECVTKEANRPVKNKQEHQANKFDYVPSVMGHKVIPELENKLDVRSEDTVAVAKHMEHNVDSMKSKPKVIRKKVLYEFVPLREVAKNVYFEAKSPPRWQNSAPRLTANKISSKKSKPATKGKFENVKSIVAEYRKSTQPQFFTNARLRKTQKIIPKAFTRKNENEAQPDIGSSNYRGVNVELPEVHYTRELGDHMIQASSVVHKHIYLPEVHYTSTTPVKMAVGKPVTRSSPTVIRHAGRAVLNPNICVDPEVSILVAKPAAHSHTLMKKPKKKTESDKPRPR